MSNIEDATKLVGQITVSDIQDLDDGTCKIVFDYDKKFKDEYKKIFNLKRFSKKHFERQLELALAHFEKKVKEDMARIQEKKE